MATIDVGLPAGRTSVSIAYEAPEAPWAALALAHGAGAAMNHPFLVGFAAALRAEGVATLRFNFPYSEAGRRMPGPVAHATATWARRSRALDRPGRRRPRRAHPAGRPSGLRPGHSGRACTEGAGSRRP